MRIPFAQIDAFADAPFTGNPAAVMPLTAWLDDATLQAIAAENNLSETAFLVSDGVAADFALRWFTPAAEVALCGHATLAAGHFVLSSGDARTRVTFATRQAGVLEVARVDAGYTLALPAWTPAAKDLGDVAATLGVADPVATLWHDKGYALIVAADAHAVRALDPSPAALATLEPMVAVITAPGDADSASDIVSRVFTPGFGIHEDPVTGSAHAVAVPYWAERLGRTRFNAFQASARGGRLSCSLEDNRVVLGGACVTVIEGTFLLP
ncbi:MAG: PhzF family phenazine biosynthesis protein [Sphingomonas bacterium]|uniref:PhzF family phenazine biosynthesis protein n=1 Tax=Sphingomonas bacterium TaxID=1895847 RepID=UPI002608B9DD|nr:PhzF family phenazine biosynthesis protein [Sphingomonas bacterium]MDB5696565.1 PhzF family phenazine biosynthesis protein [Sphingomonas bacterium]